MTLTTLILPLLIATATESPDSVAVDLDEVTVTRPATTLRLRSSAMDTDIMTRAELVRAACCNLGESFTTNPSVDVAYSDAATGARQIRLLGLAGTYVQMLSENVPFMRGIVSPYALGYTPGPWIQSIQVSKGASSVKNGYESLTGQINIEFRKPQAPREVSVNAYVDSDLKAEVNASANISLDERTSTALSVHGENGFRSHDSNGDGWADMPRVRQLSAMNRWAHMGERNIFQALAKGLHERRRGGRISGHHGAEGNPDDIKLATDAVEGWVKDAWIFDPDNGGNVALILSGSYASRDDIYGPRGYSADDLNLYASLMFERKWREGMHALSAGLSWNYDHISQTYRGTGLIHAGEEGSWREIESVGGGYAQYTLNLDEKVIAMGGIRYDRSNLNGNMVTPRLHLRWNPADTWSWHASAGRGYRTPHVMAENSSLLASSRTIVIDPGLRAEEGWNFGAGGEWSPEIAGRTLRIGVEYYHTRFRNQLVADLDSDPGAVWFHNLDGRSYSNTVQAEVSYDLLDDLSATAAWRLTDVMTDYGNGPEQKPLTPRNRAMLSLSYAPMMGLWQFDVTGTYNGPGRMPRPAMDSDGNPRWEPRFPGYFQLNAQITRNFRHWAIYIGGENLTGYRQKTPVIGATDPWGPGFDATMVYAPLSGTMVYAGFRYNLKY